MENQPSPPAAQDSPSVKSIFESILAANPNLPAKWEQRRMKEEQDEAKRALAAEQARLREQQEILAREFKSRTLSHELSEGIAGHAAMLGGQANTEKEALDLAEEVSKMLQDANKETEYAKREEKLALGLLSLAERTDGFLAKNGKHIITHEETLRLYDEALGAAGGARLIDPRHSQDPNPQTSQRMTDLGSRPEEANRLKERQEETAKLLEKARKSETCGGDFRQQFDDATYKTDSMFTLRERERRSLDLDMQARPEHYRRLDEIAKLVEGTVSGRGRGITEPGELRVPRNEGAARPNLIRPPVAMPTRRPDEDGHQK